MPRNTSSSMFTALFEELSRMTADQLDALLTEAHRVASKVFASNPDIGDFKLMWNEQALLNRGLFSACVIMVRDRLNVSVSRAKALVDRVRGIPADNPPTTESGLTPEELDMLNNSPIDCVKMIRKRTGLGLAEAKMVMDRACGSMPTTEAIVDRAR